MSIKVVNWAPAISEDGRKILDAALPFVEKLALTFGSSIQDLLEYRKTDDQVTEICSHDGNWKVGRIPADLLTRTVEITGPPTRKMVINALNSGADCYMADFEDSCSPTWSNLVEGQVNLRDAVNGTISLQSKNKQYSLCDNPAVLMVRPRGLHMPEYHVEVNGHPIPGCLFDFGVFLYTNAHELLGKGSGPYFYIPKLESAREAALWNEIFNYAEDEIGLYRGSIKCTVLIETLPAAFQMDEILFALRNHIVGLNCGRWDYIFSIIKNRPDAVMPDRNQVGMDQHAMKSYANLLIETCHKRGAFAMGGMAAQIPIKNDPMANRAALKKVRIDKEREALAGHDGTWIAHPGLLETARKAFAPFHDGVNTNSLHVMRSANVTEEDLLARPEGGISMACVRTNVEVCMKYMEAWLAGNGCVPINNLMEDAATAEISRTQLWQWVHNKSRTREVDMDGPLVTVELIRSIIDSMDMDDERPGRILLEMTASKTCEDFLTLRAYDELIAAEQNLT